MNKEQYPQNKITHMLTFPLHYTYWHIFELIGQLVRVRVLSEASDFVTYFFYTFSNLSSDPLVLCSHISVSWVCRCIC